MIHSNFDQSSFFQVFLRFLFIIAMFDFYNEFDKFCYLGPITYLSCSQILYQNIMILWPYVLLDSLSKANYIKPQHCKQHNRIFLLKKDL